MRVVVLGSAAGGGYPQWNCRCRVCALAWSGDTRVAVRTQSSIAATADGEHWLLINASPDLRQQIIDTPAVAPAAMADVSSRHSPLRAVLLTNGDVDHVAGLLTLRERQPLTLHATGEVLQVLADNPIFGVLDPTLVARRAARLDETFEPVPGLSVTLFAVPGKVPLYLEGESVDVGSEGEMTVGVRLEARGRTAHYIPGCAAVTERLRERIAGTDLLLFDGTVFEDDEMRQAGVGEKTGRRMGHLPIAGSDGSLLALADADVGRRIYIHINNTNPILIEDSPERRIVEEAGWEVARDGMELRP
ncbi:pyrroloquinoline quinone biosynthesis protein PqqB [Mangrovibrevibacter kandeliae]|uniref:pyrroloquinoline quinone biosynthesis protein PqqB n=1 Tax=Mangrovibrevibacter kandeliae TaxID=2968473 RepID=UPI00211894A5|nr:pyrroloquinoline quinone biosynthesis protein PqqB [Aurantimonas sp. CSK15Z-1]MCQ8783124.1 pyrroloquinoline quinone biosynthesis protein PqqB [Aurantimonas sp. CSK15Z-1]